MMRIDRGQFLLGSAATGALALTGCVGVSRSGTGDARQLYDRIFQTMLRQSPELATGRGLDTGANADLRAKRVAVRTGDIWGDRVEVLKGLQADERVVVSGQIKLSDGTPLEALADDALQNDSSARKRRP